MGLTTTTMTVTAEVEVEVEVAVVVEGVAAKMKRTVERRKTAQRKMRLILKVWSSREAAAAASSQQIPGR